MAETGGMSIKDAVAAEIAASMKSNLGHIRMAGGTKSAAHLHGDKGLAVEWADNSLTCDSEGNCMLKDKLATNALTCDSEGNCMLKDKLGSVSGSIGKFSAGAKWADNSLTCDSEGNCMLKDELKGVDF